MEMMAFADTDKTSSPKHKAQVSGCGLYLHNKMILLKYIRCDIFFNH